MEFIMPLSTPKGLAAPVGLEPTTYGLTVRRSTNWTKEPNQKFWSVNFLEDFHLECFVYFEHLLTSDTHSSLPYFYISSL